VTIISAAIMLGLVMDPLGNAPTFSAILQNVREEKRRGVIVRELLIALGILIAFLFFGSQLLGAMNISTPALSISGGVVLFIIAIRMIFPSRPHVSAEDEEDPFIVPLAMPLIAGPSTMTMVILLATSEPGRMLDWLAALLAAWGVTAVILLSSERLLRVIRQRGQRALVRLMGMVLTAMAVQMLLNGIGQFLSGLA
jgi:multiple antibiotic resistance protein